MLRVRQLNSKRGRQVKITLLTPKFVFLCHDVFNITPPKWHGIDLQFSVKVFLPQYSHYVHYVGHKRYHFNVTHIWSKQAMHWITSLHLRNECLFFWVHGEWIVARDKQIAWTAEWFSADLFVPRYDSFPMNPEKKDTHSLYLQCFQPRTLSKILREKL